jgi:transformer-2 protein
LSSRITEDSLLDKFERFGLIQSIHIIKDPYTKYIILLTIFNRESRGFCFIYFNDKEDAVKAMEAVNGKEIEGKSVRI